MSDDDKKLSREEISYISFEILKKVQAGVAKITDTVREHDRRFDAIERSLNSLRMDIAALSDLGVDQRQNYRSLADRIARIERRLDLHDDNPPAE